MGADELKEAINHGWLGGKLNVTKSIKVTEEMWQAMQIEADVRDMDIAEWLRELIAEKLLQEEDKFNRKLRARQHAKYTSVTSDTSVNQQQKSPVAGTTELDHS
jgi:hypothetical protein